MIPRTRPRPAAILAGAVLALLLYPGPAPAQQPAVWEWFGSELEAVAAAAARHNPLSVRDDREFMGAILRAGDRYAYTVGAGKPGRDEVRVRVLVPDGVDIVAFWHTHGAAALGNRYFSDVDTRLVRRWNKPLYLADYTGYLKVLVPGARTISALRARRLGLPARAGYAVGRIVCDATGEPVRILTR